MNLESLLWPLDQLDKALEQLTRQSGFGGQFDSDLPKPPPNLARLDAEQVGLWLELLATHLRVEVEPVQCTYAEVDRLLGHSGPLLLRLPAIGEPQSNAEAAQPGLRILALRRGGRQSIEVLAPDCTLQRIATQTVRDALCAEIEAPRQAVLDRLLLAINLPAQRQQQVRRTLLNEQLATQPLQIGWLLRLPPAQNLSVQNLWQQVQRLRLLAPFSLLLGSMITQQGLTLLAWWVIGGSVLQGHFEWGRLWLWALLLISTIFLQFLGSSAQQWIAMRSGAFFKQRLLYGVLRLTPEEIRHQGMGQFLHRIMDSEAVEMFALNGGFGVLLTLIQLGTAITVLQLGVGGWRLPGLLLLWIVLVTLGGWLYLQRNLSWDDVYESMINDQVERMVGHRTRLAQEEQRHWHEGEDSALDRYLRASLAVDRVALGLQTFSVRGWQVIGLATLFAMLACGQNNCSALAQQLPSLQPLLTLFSTGLPSSPQSLATALVISLGGLLLAQQALSGLFAGLQSLISLITAWRQVRPLFAAAGRGEPPAAVALFAQPAAPRSLRQAQSAGGELGEPPDRGQPLLLAQQIDFRYRNEGRMTVQGADLQIYAGDRILLEGGSGGGKSTLAALLAGLRQPTSGLLLLWGFDRPTLGSAEWRRRVVVAPQFHENHVFSETFAFNLLMGRRWPPQAEDIQQAEQICYELGLGDLIERMPAGLQQLVGESGWRLSHGERSRMYIARTLLQESDLMILDESFAALDPQTLQTCLECVLRRAPALVVIAHP